MESYNLKCFHRNSDYDVAAYFDSNYLTRSIMGIKNNSNMINDGKCNIRPNKMDIDYKAGQSSNFIPASNMLEEVNLYPKKSSCPVKNYKQLNLPFQEHINLMPISTSFLIGGYVGSKSQKENAHRTRLNVQIQDFILSKFFDFAIQSVKTKCRSINKSKYFEMTIPSGSDGVHGNDSLNIIKSSEECSFKSNCHINYPNIDIISRTKQSYADVTKAVVPECSTKNKLLQSKSKVPVTEFKNELSDRNIKINSMKKYKCDHSIVNSTSLNSMDSAIAFDTLYSCHKNNFLKSHKPHKLNMKKSKNYKSSKFLESEKSTKFISDLDSNSMKEFSDTNRLTKVSKNRKILKEHLHNRFLSEREDIKQFDNMDQFVNKMRDVLSSDSSIDKFVHPHENDSCFELSYKPKQICELFYNPSELPVPFFSKDDKHLSDKRNRAISECSIDSEDSFIVFTYDCDHGNFNQIEEVDDIILSDSSSFSDYGYCEKDLNNHKTKTVTDEAEEKEISSNSSTKKTKKKKVMFCQGKSLVQVHPMIYWEYAYRTARIGPWETYARDSARFASRILRVGLALNRVLQAEHRDKIYKERFTLLED